MDEDYEALIDSEFEAAAAAATAAEQSLNAANNVNNANDEGRMDIDDNGVGAETINDGNAFPGDGGGQGSGSGSGSAEEVTNDQDVIHPDEFRLQFGDDPVELDKVDNDLTMDGNVDVEDGSEGRGKGKRKRGGKSGGGSRLTDEEKKARTKAQNRKAAEKSRSKKKSEYSQMEEAVSHLHDENARLRQRLSSLLAAKNNSSTIDPSIEPNNVASTSQADPTQTGTNIDYAYISKIQKELIAARSTLLERQLQLAGLANEDISEETRSLRQTLLDQHGEVVTLQAEVSSLESLKANLKREKEDIAKHTTDINKEIEYVKNPASSGQGAEEGENGENGEVGERDGEKGAGTEKSLLDIGGWVDAAVRDLTQMSGNSGNGEVVS